MNICRWTVRTVTFFLLALLFYPGQTGFAAIPESYNIDLIYAASENAVPEVLKAEEATRRQTITVAEFTDARSAKDKKIIGYVREIGDIRVPVYARKIAIPRVLADGVKAYLKDAGYSVADKIASWNPEGNSAPEGAGKVLIGGAIDNLEISCWTGVFTDDYHIRMKITLVVADGASGKILYKGKVSVDRSKTATSFSEGQLGQEASLAMAEAIEKLFEGRTVAQQIKQALVK